MIGLDGRPLRVQGYGLCWRDEAILDDGSRETFGPYAFSRHHDSIEGSLAYLTLAHDKSRRYARASTGQLRLSEDDHGLRFEVDAAHGRDWQHLLASIVQGARSCSFTFTALRTEPIKGGERVLAAYLNEVAITEAGSYPSGGCWLSDEDRLDLPLRLRSLREHWDADQQDLRSCLSPLDPKPKATRPAPRSPVRPAAQASSTAALLARWPIHNGSVICDRRWTRRAFGR